MLMETKSEQGNKAILFCFLLGLLLLAIGSDFFSRATKPEATHVIGETVTLSDSEWTIVGVGSRRGEPEPSNLRAGLPATENRAYISVEFTVKNISSHLQRFHNSPALFDERDNRIPCIDIVPMFIPEHGSEDDLESILPGTTKSFSSLFEVPGDPKTLSLEVSPLSTSTPEAKRILLSDSKPG